jgi:general stress protein YciG
MMDDKEKQEHMREIGKKGGRSRSERKLEACRANGKKGGRPRKVKKEQKE